LERLGVIGAITNPTLDRQAAELIGGEKRVLRWRMMDATGYVFSAASRAGVKPTKENSPPGRIYF
jgi:hypothetical protein